MVRTCPSCSAKNRIPAARLMDRAKCGRCKTALEPPREPIEVTDAAMFDEIIGGAPVPVLVDFWAEWCGPCRMVAPEVKKVAEDLAGRAVVLKVDTEALPQVAGRYGIQAIPNFIVFKQGKVAVQQAGAMRAPQLMQLVR